MESVGFLLYAAALAMAELALVQSIAAGGIGALGFASVRLAGRSLRRREMIGVLISIFGSPALGVSLAGGSSAAGQGTAAPIVLWLGVTAGVAIVIVLPGRKLVGVAVGYGIAGGLLFSIGDVATKVATEGGVRLAFVIPLIMGYTGGTALLQVGYQAGGALTVAGIATLLTNALPIAVGAVVLDEPVPAGALGALRVVAFAAVITGSVLLARPDKPIKTRTQHRAAEAASRPAGAPP